MIINHNMSAINANRQMSTNQAATAKSTEKLSSGLRINRAGDDAAGLSISEKMRSQIRGLDQASSNAQDGISLLQTAEGALNETHSILQRVRELANQGANGTTVEADREAIDEEIGQLTKELDRIAETTEFNTQNLLDGKFEAKFQIGANNGQTLDIKINAMTSKSLGLVSGSEVKATISGAGKLEDGTYTIDGDDVKDQKGNVVGQYETKTGKGEITLADASKIELDHTLTDGSSFVKKGNDATVSLKADDLDKALEKLAPGDYKVSGNNLLIGDKLVGTLGATSSGTDRATLTLADGSGTVDLSTLGITGKDAVGTAIGGDLKDGGSFTIKGVDVSTTDKATGSLKTLDKAIETVSKQRSSLGALQNRLEHTISNLDNASENTQAAESRVRDVDMAEEMMEFTKNNVLSQASQAMLAQAKALPNQVLSLLQ